MRKTLSVLCMALLILTHTVLSVLAGETPVSVAGTVSDAAGKPVTTAKVVIKDSNGKSLDEAATTAQGRYRLNGLEPGQYRLTLASVGASFPEKTVVANLGDQGLTVNWLVAAAVAPIATAQPGIAETGVLSRMGDASTVAGINVLGASVGTGIAHFTGALGNNDKKRAPSGTPSL